VKNNEVFKEPIKILADIRHSLYISGFLPISETVSPKVSLIQISGQFCFAHEKKPNGSFSEGLSIMKECEGAKQHG